MSEKDKEILEIFRKTLPLLSEQEKKELMCFGEGLAFKASSAARPGA